MSGMYLLVALRTFLLFVLVWESAAQEVVTAGTIPPADQTYDFSSADRCRLLAHRSVELKNNDQHILVLDGGFGSFSTDFESNPVTVLDLNPWTVAFDLSVDFQTPDLEPLWAIKKPNGTSGPPVTNTGGLWTSLDQSVIWHQGGHFYNASDWVSSLYHVNKSDIPSWQLWQMNTSDHQGGWTNVTADTAGHDTAVRTFAGAAVSVPKANKSFWLGGLIDSFTSASTPNNTIQTTGQMLVYDQTKGAISSQSYYPSQSTQDQGQYQGNLLHLPIGSGSGYLISLMAEERPINQPWTDPDGADGNLEVGVPVSLDSIPMYDVDSDSWFEQPTSWYNSEIPEPRTRFCAAIFHDETDGTWNLWMHGGQQLSNQNEGIEDIYVLSMPSFIWTKVQTTIPDTNLIRSHTCHAVGGQFIIVGGWPPGLDESRENVTCDPEYIKVLRIDQGGPTWAGSYSTKTTYANPQSVRDVVGSRTSPIGGFANAKLQNDFKPGHASQGKIIGGAVGGGVGGFAILGVVVWWFWRRRRHARTQSEEPVREAPRSPPNEQPELVTDGHLRDPGRRETFGTVVTTSVIDHGDTHELEAAIIKSERGN